MFALLACPITQKWTCINFTVFSFFLIPEPHIASLIHVHNAKMELSTMGGRRLTSQQLQQLDQIQRQQQSQRQQRLHNRHYRKDTSATLGKNVGKFMYPPSSPSLQVNENFYHQHTQPRRTNNHWNSPSEDPDVIEVYLEDDPMKLKELNRHDAREVS
jgi:hypothetical protein